MPMKLKHFLWRLLSKSLATGNNLKRRHVTLNDQCRRCCTAEETEEHLFFECPYGKSIWRDSGISNTIIISSVTTLEEKIEACLQCSLSTRLQHIQDLPIWILWRIWKSRNMLVFQQKTFHWRSLIKNAREDAREWNQNFKTGEYTAEGQRRTMIAFARSYWTRPPEGWIKCNTDGTFINSHITSTAGWIFRDGSGTYSGAAQG